MKIDLNKIAAFDIEIVNEYDTDMQLQEQLPLGVSCIGVASTSNTPNVKTVFHEYYPGCHHNAKPGEVGGAMEPADIKRFIDHLLSLHWSDYTIVSWNGMGFDFEVLAYESDTYEVLSQIARDHWDIMFQVLCIKGFPVGLTSCSKAFSVGEKAEGISGADVPKLWAAGITGKDIRTMEAMGTQPAEIKQLLKEGVEARQKVIRYVRGDALLTLDVAKAILMSGELRWITQKGKRNSISPFKPLSAMESNRLPYPNTSWMTNPIKRSRFTEWLTEAIDRP